jgi:hypothetical protein
MAKRKKDRQYNGQEKKGQIIQWPREKRTDNTMGKRIFSWPLYYLSFSLLAIVLSVLFSLGHCIICPFFSWP